MWALYAILTKTPTQHSKTENKTGMRTIKKIGLFTLIILINIGCRNSSQSKVAQIQTKGYDSTEETNDWYIDADGNSKTLKLVRANGKIGFIYENGEELFPCIFDSVVDAENYAYGNVNGKYVRTNKGYFSRCAKVKKDGKWGLINIEGKVIISFNYDDIYAFDYKKTSRMEGPYIEYLDYDGKTAIVKRDGKWGLVNTKDEVFADCVYDEFSIPEVQLFYEKRAAAKKDGLWGFLNEKGNPISSFIYEAVGGYSLETPQSISIFYGGLAVVKKVGKWGAIDLDGKEIIPFIYDFISSFTSETAIAQKEGKWGYINKKGEEVIPLIYDEIKWFELGLCPIRKNGLWGFLNEKGELIVPIMYDDILVSEEVSVDGGLWFFSQDGLCAVKKNGKWGLIDNENNIVVDFEYDGIKFTTSGLDDWRYFSDGFLSVKKGKFWSVINKDGLNKIPFEYDDVEIWSEGNVCIKRNNKWGLLDSLGKQLVPIEHKNAMDAGNFNYKTNNK
jgi:hypothetical protein